MPTAPKQHGQARRTGARAANQRRYDKHQRQNAKFYHSAAWKRARSWYLTKNPLCTECQAEGFIKSADVVDHIVEIKDGGELLNSNNLQSLCHKHHNQKTARAAKARAS